jgi:hypothetical protein
MNKRRFIIFIFLFSLGWSLFAHSSYSDSLHCNGDPNLCDRRYNEVTYLTAHNAQSEKRNRFLKWLPGSNINNQTHPILFQLKNGVRAMKMPVHGYKKDIYVCHGMGHWIKSEIERRICNNFPVFSEYCSEVIGDLNPCFIDPGSKSLMSVLVFVRDFIRENPNEVVTLFLEDDFGHFELIHKAFEDSGLLSELHQQNESKEWPTLKEMIQNRKRVVVFLNRTMDLDGHLIQQYPLFNSMHFFVWSTSHHFSNLQELEMDTPDSSDFNRSAFLDRYLAPHNKLWLVQHFITPTIAGNERMANLANEPSLLMNRIRLYQKVLGTPPNFVSIDFFRPPSHGSGPLDVVHALNREREGRRPASQSSQ